MTKYRSPIIMAGAVTVCVVFASGCTDLKPTQAQIDDLKSEVAKLSSAQASAGSRTDAASGVAQAAAANAQRAQSTADSASATATKNQQAIEAIDEKIDRIFRRKAYKQVGKSAAEAAASPPLTSERK